MPGSRVFIIPSVRPTKLRLRMGINQRKIAESKTQAIAQALLKLFHHRIRLAASGVLLSAKSRAGVPAGKAVGPFARGRDREGSGFCATYIRSAPVQLASVSCL